MHQGGGAGLEFELATGPAPQGNELVLETGPVAVWWERLLRNEPLPGLTPC
jgi:hypothetical protein